MLLRFLLLPLPPWPFAAPFTLVPFRSSTSSNLHFAAAVVVLSFVILSRAFSLSVYCFLFPFVFPRLFHCMCVCVCVCAIFLTFQMLLISFKVISLLFLLLFAFITRLQYNAIYDSYAPNWGLARPIDLDKRSRHFQFKLCLRKESNTHHWQQ